MKDKLKLIGYAKCVFDSCKYRIEANSHSIRFGDYRLTKLELNKKLKKGKGTFTCCASYRWRLKNGGIDEYYIGYKVFPATYKKIVKWSKSK